MYQDVLSWQGGTYGISGQPTYTTNYFYDALTQVAQGGQNRIFYYDSLKRLVQSTNPESGTINFTDDTSGNLATRADQRVVSGSTHYTATMAYDGINRLTQKSYNDTSNPTPWVTNTYDSGGSAANANGRLTLAQSGIVYYYRTYDTMGRVSTSQEAFAGGSSYSMSYGYNLASLPTSFTFPSLRQQTITYDIAGRTTGTTGSASGVNTTYASSLSYFPDRSLQQMTVGNPAIALVETTTQNNRLQVTGRTAAKPGVNLLQLGFVYGSAGSNNGNLTSETIVTSGSPAINVTQTYTADAFNRLLTASETSGWSQGYAYDAVGNRTVSGTYIPNASLTPKAGDTFPNNQWSGGSYDLAGNQLTTPGNVYTYDAENRLATANAAGMGVVSYLYDGEGRRVKKSASTFTETYVLDSGGRTIAEYSTQAPVSSGTEFLTVDHLGSTRMVTDSLGNLLRRYDYLPFGEEIAAGVFGRTTANGYVAATYPAGPDAVDRKFTGKERDAETGLDFFGARYFSGAQGRFTSPDEVFADQHVSDPQSWNLYAYVRNNPLRNVDPNGKGACGVGVSNCGSYIAGGLKAIFNTIPDSITLLNHAVNWAISPLTTAKFADAPRLEPSDYDEGKGMEAANAVMLVSPAAEMGAAKLAGALGGEASIEGVAAAALKQDVPTSISAGPGPRPTAAQQRAINEMDNAHGCNTCGSTTPGTASGNWVGDHQPPTKLNPSGAAQVYEPQCLQCSRQQGGRVAAAVKKARRVNEPQEQ